MSTNKTEKEIWEEKLLINTLKLAKCFGKENVRWKSSYMNAEERKMFNECTLP